MKGVKILDYSKVTLQRHGARHIYVVPEGLKELMMDISREVLRHQPENIYAFCANYCEALMITRENARVAASVVESITDCSITIAELLQKTGIDRNKVNRVATIIQRAFRNFLARRQYPKTADKATEDHMLTELLAELDVPITDLERTARVIQSAYRAFKERQKIFRDDEEFVNWRKALQDTMYIYRKTGVPEEMVLRAASTIQAAYRGYYTRRHIMNAKRRYESSQQQKPPKFPPEVQQTFARLNIDPYSKEVEHAVIKIQHAVRQYLSKISAEFIAKDVMNALTQKIGESPSPSESPERKVSPKKQKVSHFLSDSVLVDGGKRMKKWGPEYFQPETSKTKRNIQIYSTEIGKKLMSPLKEEVINKRDTKPEYIITETQVSPTTRRIEETVKRLGSDSEYRRIETITPSSHLRQEKMKIKVVQPDQTVLEKTVKAKYYHKDFTKNKKISVDDTTAQKQKEIKEKIKEETLKPEEQMKSKINKKIIQKIVVSKTMRKEFGIDENASDVTTLEITDDAEIVDDKITEQHFQSELKQEIMEKNDTEPEIIETQLLPVKGKGSNSDNRKTETITTTTHLGSEERDQNKIQESIVQEQYHKKLSTDGYEEMFEMTESPGQDSDSGQSDIESDVGSKNFAMIPQNIDQEEIVINREDFDEEYTGIETVTTEMFEAAESPMESTWR